MIVDVDEDLVNHGKATFWYGQANRFRHCYVPRMTEVNGQSFIVDASVGVPQRRLGVMGFSLASYVYISHFLGAPFYNLPQSCGDIN